MDLLTNFILLVIAGILSYYTKYEGLEYLLNQYEQLSKLIILLIVVLLFIPALTDPANIGSVMRSIITLLFQEFPGLIVGAIAGFVVSIITGEREIDLPISWEFRV